MSRLLLVEDEENLGRTLQERLQKEGHDVRLSGTLEDARREIFLEKPDLVILDVGLPDGSGFDLAKEIKGKINCPFLFVTAQSSAESRLQGYEIGAEEFIPKPFHLKELLIRVRHVLANHSRAEQIQEDNIKIDFESQYISYPDGRREHVPIKDLQVLQLLIRKSPQVVSRDQILNEVWGQDQFPTNRTVDNTVLRLRQVLGEKLGLKIKTQRGVGYYWEN